MNNQEVSTAYVGSTEIKQVRLGSQLVLAPNGDALWYKANALPSLDLRFAEDKSLVDATTGQNLVTFSRASSGTYVDSQGVIRNAVTNLLLRSEEFDNASWTKTGLLAFGSGSTANATTAPNGTLTADLLTESTATNAERNCYQSGFTTTPATLSCYIKPNGRNFAGLRFYAASNNWVRVTFTLTGSGTASAISAGSSSDYTGTSASIASVGNGWYRVSLNATRTSGISFAVVDFATSASPALAASSGNEFYTGDGTSGIYIWGAQLEQSSTVGEYVPTGATINSAPRFDHNPTTGESLGLLVEEQRQNLLLNSGTLSTQNVTVTAVAHTLSFTGTGTITLSGTSTAGPLVGTGTGEANRVSLTFTPTAGTLTLTVSGTVTNAQLEIGAFRTSYIPTTASAATRAADVASISGSNFSSWYRQDEGTLFADTASIYNNGRYFMFDNGTTNERWEGRYSSFLAIANSWSNNVQDVSPNTSVIGGTPSTNVRVAIANASNNAAIASNGAGATVGTDSSSTMPANQSRLFIGSFQGTATFANGPIRRLTYWPQRLGNEVLQRITQ